MLSQLKTKEFWVHLFFLVCIVGLLGGFVYLLTEVKKLSEFSSSQTATQNVYNTDSTCGIECQRQIEEEFAKLSQSPAPTPKVSPTPVPSKAPVATAATTKKTTYVPFSGVFSTTSTDWTDVTGAQAYIDLKNNYSSDAYVTFEASLRSPDGGGVFARLFDATHSIAVDGSEISTTSASSVLISSGKLNLWSGNNLYKVQIKSLNSSTVYFDSGRVKLVY